MLTQDVSQELKGVLEQLHAEGKEPTVALVKARLSTSVPMPALITTLKSWKSSNRVPKVEVAAKQEVADIDRIEQLEKQVIDLTARLVALEEKLENQKFPTLSFVTLWSDKYLESRKTKGLAPCQAFLI